jgi:hypothetical protein
VAGRGWERRSFETPSSVKYTKHHKEQVLFVFAGVTSSLTARKEAANGADAPFRIEVENRNVLLREPLTFA